MRNSQLELIKELNNQRIKYAQATIVRRQIPCSSRLGDSAIITEDGTLHGWIGGGCTRGIVLKEGLECINTNRPQFIRISPSREEDSMPNTKFYTMTCQSGGSVDVFIQPVVPRPQIIIFGHSHIAIALAKLSLAMDYNVTAVHPEASSDLYGNLQALNTVTAFDPETITHNSYIVVCTQGYGDETALEQAIRTKNPYIAFVASRRKANAIYATLRERGITFEQLKHVKTPAGLDINAKLPEEVAISILAQIIKDIRETKTDPAGAKVAQFNSDEYYLNPVCQIPIQKATAKYIIEHGDTQVYFCCDGCKIKFEAAPEKYLPATTNSE